MSLIARFSVIAAIAFALASCGGGGGGGSSSKPVTTTTTPPVKTTPPTAGNAPTVALATQTASNVAPIVVNAGSSNEFPNLILVSVTVCSTTDHAACVTIPNIQVDTGSVGLRVLDSAVQSLNLTPVTTGGAPVGECAEFADGSSWGAVRYATVTVGTMSTTNLIPIQVIDDGATPADVADQANTPEPTGCSNTGTAENTAATLGANGIIGVGYFLQDCGPYCASTIGTNPNYYNCPNSSCSGTTLATQFQVSNPIAAFPAGFNNGNIIELPAVPDAGAAAAYGYLVFGVAATGSGGNNSLPAGTPIGIDDYGNLTVTFNNGSYNTSFIDSGSSVYFFNAALTQCGANSAAPGFYCPASEYMSPTTTITGNQNYLGSLSFTFNIGNAVSLFDSTSNANAFAFNNLGAPLPTTSFDVGEPFFYGRSVFTVIEGGQVGTYTGPFAAVGTAS
jgi:hypothetical protein